MTILKINNMNYLITTIDSEPFFTNWFDAENHFNADIGMIVYNLLSGKYTKDGINWNIIEEDHL